MQEQGPGLVQEWGLLLTRAGWASMLLPVAVEKQSVVEKQLVVEM